MNEWRAFDNLRNNKIAGTHPISVCVYIFVFLKETQTHKNKYTNTQTCTSWWLPSSIKDWNRPLDPGSNDAEKQGQIYIKILHEDINRSQGKSAVAKSQSLKWK